jgi:hypothetical protein
MPKRYYLDTCIWRDFYENRVSLKGRPLGKYASDLFRKIIRNKDLLFYTDLTVKELKIDYNEKEITNMFDFLFILNILRKTSINKKDYIEAKNLSKSTNVPIPDALHAIISRNNSAIFISQDKHAQRLKQITIVKRPEEVY